MTSPWAGGFAELVIEDTGPGFDDETRARLFEPFFSTKTQGSGLGLALVKKVAEDLGRLGFSRTGWRNDAGNPAIASRAKLKRTQRQTVRPVRRRAFPITATSSQLRS